MYPPNQPKVPPVRPRSSLSTDEHHRYKGSKLQSRKPSNTVLTLAAFCIFLFVLCVFLLGALVYVGRTIAVGVTNNLNVTTENADELDDSFSTISPYSYVVNLSSTEEPPVITQHSGNFRLTFRPNHNQQTTTASSAEEAYAEIRTEFSSELMNTSKIIHELSYRLPREIRPKKYRLHIHPDLKENTFNGNVTINLEVLQPISYIALHANKLNVKTEEVFRITSEASQYKNVTPSITFHHPEYELWVTEFSEALEAGEYAFRLSFNGSLTNRIVGLYQSTYWDKINNEQRSIVTSKFEPTYARQAFPCFDEPAMKAIFQVTLVQPTKGSYHALSNMNQESETIVGENTEVTFAETVPMSTYLACFIISDFAYQSAKVKGGENATDFEMRAYATKHQLSKVNYALSTGVALTEFYINYFGIPYPLPKLDLAAIPDFVSGATEHWGMVTFRETALLYDKEISSSQNKQRVATVVAHELAHMWFGNLVTMKWWNDLWLNEGFASYIEYKGLHQVHPEWKMLDQFIISDMHGVMKLDSTLASHPIVQVAENPNQITELFGQITYSKGASIIRMLENTIGSENFQNATHNYLNKFKFNNAETDDFLNEVEALGFDFDVKYMMKTWTEQMGLPVVEMIIVSDTEYKLTQKRFLANPEDYDAIATDSQFNYRWDIPITYYSNVDADVKLSWFNHIDAENIIKMNQSVEWIKINKDQIGYYLVNYPEEMWKSLTRALVHKKDAFSVSDRAHLLSDAFTLASATQLTYDIALNLTTYLETELEFVPWNVASSKLKDIKNLLYYTDLYNEFQAYVRKLIDKTVQEVKWEVDDNHLKNLLRIDILSTACGFAHTKTLEEVAVRFKAWISKPEERPHPDLRFIIYYFGMKTAGNEKYWQIMWDLFVSENDPNEKSKLMRGLAAISEPWILQRFINLAWNESYVRSQDYFTCIQQISHNPVGTNMVWDYVRENWLKIVDRFGINERNLGNMIPIITSRFSTHQKLEEIEFFFQKYPEAGAGTVARKVAIENVKSNIKWLEVNKAKVGIWLKKQRNLPSD